MRSLIWRRIWVTACILVGGLLAILVCLILYLTLTEYKPAARQAAEFVYIGEESPEAGTELTLYTWNIGYAGLGEESDFFMDGGKMVNPPSQDAVKKNIAGIQNFIAQNPADGWLLQEVDISSAHTNFANQYEQIREVYGKNGAFAYNYKCNFVPIPLPPIGKVASGIATVTDCRMQGDAQRIALPCPFSWPVSAANLKRCLLITRHPIEGTDRELVLVNLHLEAYDDGEGKLAQTQALLKVLQEEYAKGNYVIAGGDFNQTFPGGLEAFPIADPEKWTPGVLSGADLPEGWQYVCDTAAATCRLLDKPYDESCQKYVIDGFILSPNVKLTLVETVDLGFVYSDHNPVRLEVTLLP